VSYTARYRAVGSPVVQSLTVAGSPFLFTGLLPGTFYDVDIVTNCSNGAFSNNIHVSFGTITTANCGAPTNVTVTATSATTATVTFTPGAGNTSHYVNWYIPGDSTRFAASSSSPILMTGLVPGSTYIVQVHSVCGSSGTATYGSSSPLTFSFRGALSNRSSLGDGVLSVHPNPAHQSATITLPAVAGVLQAQYVLLNAVGQHVRTGALTLQPTGTRAELDLASVAPGLYTLKVVAGKKVATQRVVVE
jgi:hypothetical protein